MKKIIIWSALTTIVMIILPFLTVAFAGTAGMAICMILFLAVDPLYSVIGGILSGRCIKKLWMLPIINAAAFLAGAWLFFDMGEPAFSVYAVIYLVLGVSAMLITAFFKKVIKDKR